MLALEGAKRPERSGAAERRAVALAEADWFRAMAWTADRDGGSKRELRAADACAAARIILRQAKRDAVVNGIANQSLGAALRSPNSWTHGSDMRVVTNPIQCIRTLRFILIPPAHVSHQEIDLKFCL